MGARPRVSSRCDERCRRRCTDLASIRRATPSELRDTVERYSADRAALGRVHTAALSLLRRERFKAFYTAWQDRLKELDFEPLTQQARIDYLLLANQIRYELSVIRRDEKIMRETAMLVPFVDAITGLDDARRLELIDQAAAAATIDALVKRVDETRKAVQSGLDDKSETGPVPSGSGTVASKRPTTAARNSRDRAARRPAPPPEEAAGKTDASKPTPIETTKIVAFRAAGMVNDLKRTTGEWSSTTPATIRCSPGGRRTRTRRPTRRWPPTSRLLREKVVGYKEGDDEPIIGNPIGRDGLVADLAREMIPYTPEELIKIAEREFAWCEREMLKAPRARWASATTGRRRSKR